MKLHFQTRWLRVMVELCPAVAEIRRYRVAPLSLENQTRRLLCRQIAGRLRRPEQGQLV